MRLRIDGKVHEIDDLPKLKKNVKHTIEVVVDRLKVRADAKQRLAESFETALRHADGRALAVEMDSGKEHLFSAQLRLPGLQLFAAGAGAAPVFVQQPDGRVPALRRPGHDQFFRSQARRRLSRSVACVRRDQRLGPAQPVLFPDAAMPGAALRLRSRAAVHELPEKVQNAVLYGSGREKIRFIYVGERGNKHVREHAFEGVIPNLERRYRETDSVVVTRRARQISQQAGLPRMRRHAAAARSAPRHRGGQSDL